LRYDRNTHLDSTDYNFQGALSYRLDPRLSVSGSAGYVRDSRPGRTDLNGLSLTTGSDRWSCQLSGNYAVSEKSSAMVSYAFSSEVFDNPTSDSTTVHAVNFSQDYDLDRYLRQTKLVGKLGYFRSLTDTTQVDNYSATLGITKKIHELWIISLNAGGRYTHSEFDAAGATTPTQTIMDDDQGMVGDVSIQYAGEKTHGSLTFNHDVTTAAGRGGATLRTGAAATVNEKFTRELSGFMGLGYSWNRSNHNQFQFASVPIDEMNLNVTGGLRYEFSNYVSLDGSYRYNNIYYRRLSTEANQNVFMLRLTIRRDVLDL
jgi:hypothetical protein